MASSQEAFATFGMWQKAQTSLKLTVLTRDERPEIFVVNVASTDEDRCLVGFVIPKTRSFLPPICFSDASFEIGNRVLEAIRPTGDLIKCEVIGP
jgi:hypothetical protein